MPARLSRPLLLLALGALFMPGCGRTKLDLFGTFAGGDDRGSGAAHSGGGSEAIAGRPSGSGAESSGGDPAHGGAPGQGGDSSVGGDAPGGAVGAAGEASGGAAGEASGGAAGSAGAGGEGPSCQATPGDPGDVHWLNTYGVDATSVTHALAVDSQGNVIVAGDFGKAIDFGDGDPLANPWASPPYYDDHLQSYLAKLDAEGNVLWAKAMLSTGDAFITGIALDPDDNIVVAGSFYGNLDLDEDDPGVHVLSALQSYCENSSCRVGSDVFVAKLTADGVVIWGNAYGDDTSDGLRALACDSAGRIAFSGIFTGLIDFSSENPPDGSGPSGTTSETLQAEGCDAYLAELDGDGNYLWSMRYGDGPQTSVCQRPAALAIADNDDVILTGGYWGSVTLSGDAADELPKVNSQEVLLARFSSAGDLVFGHGWAYTSNQYATAIALAENGDILLIGSFGQQIPFDADAPLVSAGSGDVFVARFDAQGAYIDGRTYGDSWDQQGSSIIVDDQDRITIGGRFSRAIDFGGSQPLLTTTGNYGDYDAFVVQLDSNLNATWQLTVGSTAADASPRLATLCDGSPIAAGEYAAEASLSSNGQAIADQGGQGLWLWRTAP